MLTSSAPLDYLRFAQRNSLSDLLWRPLRMVKSLCTGRAQILKYKRLYIGVYVLKPIKTMLVATTVTGVFLYPNPASAGSSQTDPASKAFSWWNDAIKSTDKLSSAEFSLYYTVDTSSIIDGCDGSIDGREFGSRFCEIANNNEKVYTDQPFENYNNHKISCLSLVRTKKSLRKSEIYIRFTLGNYGYIFSGIRPST